MEFSSLLYPAISLGGLGLAFGVLLGYASNKFKIAVDPKLPLIREALPGANCGGCGFAGCDAYADAIVRGSAAANCCTVGGAQIAEKIGGILGINQEPLEKKIAFVKCNGDCESSKNKYEYSSKISCIEASKLPGTGAKSCTFGCLGLGSCVQVCQFQAVHVSDGIARVDKSKCKACGACVEICPKNLIELIPVSKNVIVSCNSQDKGIIVRENCTVGCIGCKICENSCTYDAIHVSNNLAKIDYDKCTLCGDCVAKCPSKVIHSSLN